MQVVKLKEESTQISAKINIPLDVIEHNIKHKLLDLAKKIKVDGFRPGKVPLSIVSKKHYPSARKEAIEEKINEEINDFIKKNNLNIISNPILDDIKDDKDVGIEVLFTCYLVPNIDLPDFHSIEIEKPIFSIAEEDIQERLEELTEEFCEYKKESKLESKIGDKLIINAEATIEGKEFVEGNLKEVELILGKQGTLNKLFEEKLIGCKVGDSINLEIILPNNYKNLSGKKANFNVTVLSIFESEKSLINEDFAKKFDCKTVEELREIVVKNLQGQYKQHIKISMKMNLFNKINELTEVEIPKILLEKEITTLKDQMGSIVQEEDHLKNKTPEELELYYNKLAIRRIKIGLILAKYVESKGLKITNKDIEKAIITQANNYPGQERQVIEFYTKNPKAVESLRGPILEDLAVNDLFENNVIKLKEKEYTKVQLDNLLNKEVNYELL